MTDTVTPFSLKDAPALIERLLPVQKLSAEVYKERKAGSAQTLTALGSYWRGRKPLILAKACVLGCLLPATNQPQRDLEVFEKLMAMDDESFVVRWKQRPTRQTPISSRSDSTDAQRRHLEAMMLPQVTYRERVNQAKRPEEVIDVVHHHIWDAVNEHLGTSATSMPELVEQLGIMRFGHRPRVADTFCGSGQIPFEAARIGCDVYASDLNPVACMLTWGAFNIVGATPAVRHDLQDKQREIAKAIAAQIDELGIETDGLGWKAKAFLYCLETKCPQTGWAVPLLPSLIVSRGYSVIAELVPDEAHKRYDILIKSGASEAQMLQAQQGTVRSDGRGQDPFLVHSVGGVEYRTKLSTLRGDYRKEDGSTGNRLRPWENSDIAPRPDDILQERLYCIQWMRRKNKGRGDEYDFRGITPDDLKREHVVEEFVSEHFADWQSNGFVPNMRIEHGAETERLYRERGWTQWHHLFHPRQLLVAAIYRSKCDSKTALGFAQLLNYGSRLCYWDTTAARLSKDGTGKQVGGASNAGVSTFYNQALNTFPNYCVRGSRDLLSSSEGNYKSVELPDTARIVATHPADAIACENDVYVTDPPYGDAVQYDEILEFFIAWLRNNPPDEFKDWVWDSRRALAIKGSDENFRRGMVGAYRRMTELMPNNGLQVIMFTHQSGSIWADMANIVWAAGLHVTAAWYVATETDTALRAGSYVKGTVLLICRKRQGVIKATRDDLAWEIQEEVAGQVASLTGLNQDAKGLYRDENVFEDADIQMAGYAAALRVLTRYAMIDGRDMTAEAIRPRVKGETTFVDGLITFAVDTANQCLVPLGIAKDHWDKLSGAERFYLKMLDMEARGTKTLDNYQNFAKAFKVRDFKPLLASHKANAARLKSAAELGRAEMNEGSEMNQSVLRAVLYGLMELEKNVDGREVLAHLTLNIPNYYGDMTQRELAVEVSDYLAKRLEGLRPDEARNARVLYELIKNQRLG
jgi:putative DNA methylase